LEGRLFQIQASFHPLGMLLHGQPLSCSYSMAIRSERKKNFHPNPSLILRSVYRMG
jgi:hypothetical protein